MSGNGLRTGAEGNEILTIKKYTKMLKSKLTFCACALLAAVLLQSCGELAPHHKVYQGKQNMIVYSVKANERKKDKYGAYEYWITDATGQDWTLLSDEVFNLGDTVTVQKHCR